MVAARRGSAVRITPLDIRNHAFPRRVSGYDREEVDTFLRMLAEDYEAALRESQSLRERVNQLELRVHELTASEQLLQDTLTTAQRLADDLKQTAMKEAELMVSEAELQGEKVLDAAHRRASRLAEDIREMKHVRVRLAASIRATIETHLGLLDSLADGGAQEDPDLERRMSVLARTVGERKPSAET
jgi:cell division initiation protein